VAARVKALADECLRLRTTNRKTDSSRGPGTRGLMVSISAHPALKTLGYLLPSRNAGLIVACSGSVDVSSLHDAALRPPSGQALSPRDKVQGTHASIGGKR
jgi:hypothetical protein